MGPGFIIPLKYGKLATKYPRIYGYFYSALQNVSFSRFCFLFYRRSVVVAAVAYSSGYIDFSANCSVHDLLSIRSREVL